MSNIFEGVTNTELAIGGSVIAAVVGLVLWATFGAGRRTGFGEGVDHQQGWNNVSGRGNA